MCSMKPIIKIRFNETKIELVSEAQQQYNPNTYQYKSTIPNCNQNRLNKISFEFNHSRKIIDCIGTIKNVANPNHNYAGSGLARLYEKALRRLTARQSSATILRFPNGEG